MLGSASWSHSISRRHRFTAVQQNQYSLSALSLFSDCLHLLKACEHSQCSPSAFVCGLRGCCETPCSFCCKGPCHWRQLMQPLSHVCNLRDCCWSSCWAHDQLRTFTSPAMQPVGLLCDLMAWIFALPNSCCFVASRPCLFHCAVCTSCFVRCKLSAKASTRFQICAAWGMWGSCTASCCFQWHFCTSSNVRWIAAMLIMCNAVVGRRCQSAGCQLAESVWHLCS